MDVSFGDGVTVQSFTNLYGCSIGAETRIGRLILGTLMVGVLGTLGVVMVTREGTPRARINYANGDSALLDLSVRDDYYSIVSKLGSPATDHSITKAGDLEFRSLWYPQRSYYVILMGAERNNLRYIGAMDKDWRVMHSVALPGGVSTASMLRELQKF